MRKVLLLRGTGIAGMHMRVDESGEDEQTTNIEPLVSRDTSRRLQESGHSFALDQDICGTTT